MRGLLAALLVVASFAAEAHALSDPFTVPGQREREERRAIEADSAGDAAKATDLALRRSLYFRALGAYGVGARLAVWAASRSDGAARPNALLEAAYLYTMDGDTAHSRSTTDQAAALIGIDDALARARLAIQRARLTNDEAAVQTLPAFTRDDAPPDVRFVAATALSVALSNLKRYDAAREMSDLCWALHETVDAALPEHLACLQQRLFVLHTLDVDGRETERAAIALAAWTDARVGAGTPALVLTLVNYCNLSFPEDADYARSERACERAQQLLDHPDIAGRRSLYAYPLALGHGMAIQNQGRAKDALPYLSQALTLATLAKKDEDIRNALVNFGWAQFQAGDAEAAKRLLERLPREAPNSPYTMPALLSLGDIACNAGLYDEARLRFETGKALAVKIEGDTSPRQRHFVQRLEMLDGVGDERCNKP
ncbi:MAG TPA: tetratricopeptide repeat protein [Tahibacter sp.]|nr:tetratricopeptide repeat protein [Tahibacter sp.]